MLEKIQPFFQQSNEAHIWLTQVFIAVFITVSINFILIRLLHLAEKVTKKTSSLWDDALLEAAQLPVRLFVWTIGLSFAATILDNVTQTAIFSYLPRARSIAYILIIAMFAIRFINYAEKNIVNPSRVTEPMDKVTARAIAKLLRVSVMITAGMIIMQDLGYSISGVLAFGGVGGIAIGFAAKDLLANFFGGMMIYLDKPFIVGDWVRSPDRQIEGTVEDIGWRLTRIRTFDKRPLYLPNYMFATIVVENPSRMTNRRIYENLGIRYSDGHLMKVICDDVRAMIQSHPDIDQKQTIIVHFNRYGDSYLEFMLYAFTKTSERVPYHAIKENVLLKVMEIVEGHGAEFAFPTRTLHVAVDGHPDEAAIMQKITEEGRP